jgi:hypothetical protein
MLRQEISKVVVGWDVVDGDVFPLDVIVHECVFDCNVFESLWPCEDRFVNDGDGRLVVVEDLNWSIE